MEFGSSFVYLYDEPEEEIISDDELDQGMYLSSSESDLDDDGPCTEGKRHYWRNVNSTDDMYRSEELRISGRKVRRADTNVVSVDFSKLVAPGHMFTGDPVYCEKCRGVLSHISHIMRTEDSQVWKCEFCETINHINMSDDEIPKQSDVTFMKEPTMETTPSQSSESSDSDESLIVFCIDVSGSMSDKIKVPGKRAFRGHKPSLTSKEQRYEKHGEVTYISRLQAVQNAVEQQLEMLYKNHPKRKVAIITFHDEVEVVGDPYVNRIASDRTLEIWNDLRDIGSRLSLPASIKETKSQLTKEVFSLRTLGSTALGPVLLISTTFASKYPGSKVIICTDGQANTGLGSLQGGDIYQEGDFYDRVGKVASVKGVTISVMSFRDTDCRLVHLGKLADRTAGKVNMVDFDKLQQEFSSIVSTNIIATNVVLTAILHKQLYVINDDEKKENRFVKQIGNVTADTEVTFEYGVRPTVNAYDTGSTQSVQTDDTLNQNAMTEIPFQIQITYTNKDGTALRVITKKKTTTRERQIAEQNANVKIIGCNAQRQVANLALDGRFTDSRTKAMMNQRLLWRHKKIAPNSTDKEESRKMYKKICSKILNLECKVLARQKEERQQRGRSYSRSLSRSRSRSGGRSRSMSPRSRSRSQSRGRSRSCSRGRARISRGKKQQAQRAKQMSDAFSVSLYKSKFCRTDNIERSRSRSFSPVSNDSNSSIMSVSDGSDSCSDSDSSSGRSRTHRRRSLSPRRSRRSYSRSASPYLSPRRRRRSYSRSVSPYLNRRKTRSNCERSPSIRRFGRNSYGRRCGSISPKNSRASYRNRRWRRSTSRGRRVRSRSPSYD